MEAAAKPTWKFLWRLLAGAARVCCTKKRSLGYCQGETHFIDVALSVPTPQHTEDCTHDQQTN